MLMNHLGNNNYELKALCAIASIFEKGLPMLSSNINSSLKYSSKKVFVLYDRYFLILFLNLKEIEII